jgi:hypothetical protein
MPPIAESCIRTNCRGCKSGRWLRTHSVHTVQYCTIHALCRIATLACSLTPALFAVAKNLLSHSSSLRPESEL